MEGASTAQPYEAGAVQPPPMTGGVGAPPVAFVQATPSSYQSSSSFETTINPVGAYVQTPIQPPIPPNSSAYQQSVFPSSFQQTQPLNSVVNFGYPTQQYPSPQNAPQSSYPNAGMAMPTSSQQLNTQISRISVILDLSIKQIQQLRAQITAYRYTSRGPVGELDQLPYSLPAVLQYFQQRSNRLTPIPRPVGIDPVELMKEREYRMQNRIGLRIKELETSLLTVDPKLRTGMELELRSLKFLNYQRQLRGEIVSMMKQETALEMSLNPRSYRRPKKQSLREARVTEKLEKQQKLELERKRRQRHQEFLNAVIQHGKEFKEYHRNNQVKNSKLKKAVLTYHSNTERERRKEEERREKERMAKLMQEDEEGYRKLLDQKKDKRLVYLLQQTDEYINSLVGLVKQHQAAEKKRKKMEKRALKEQRRKERQERKRQEEEVKKQQAIENGQEYIVSNNESRPDDENSQNSDLPVKIRELATGTLKCLTIQIFSLTHFLEKNQYVYSFTLPCSSTNSPSIDSRNETDSISSQSESSDDEVSSSGNE
uniref:HSA domain-containing protein n=1 Tax=Romanomermis culicivorax TaxID=13658 RepID=A0A915ITP7_ROMCU